MIHNIQKAYFDWMSCLAFSDKNHRQHYKSLLKTLNDIGFRYIIPLDENRMTDGIDLRYRFCYEHGLENEIMEGVSNPNQCSVLEMMIALALRCDEHIMFDSDIGNRVSLWFCEMLKNLGLLNFTDDIFDEHECLYIINKMLNRDYEPNGYGGLFILKKRNVDMRNVEIWYQLSWYLNENYKT